ncbi:SDR family NAD(P)-dependent oxidoreductase [Streptomyces sp. NPDC048251]|uniref:SDR family NAD(P)-dependent oxidoreductase n=1 Tax=Streptomyces sp. NPDC048251 TaxID=3154501 RepID=UPI00342C0864
MSLDGRTALVTGGGGPLGRAFALALSAAGARVLLTGRNRASLTEAAERVAEGGVRRSVTCPTRSRSAPWPPNSPTRTCRCS